MKKCEYCHNLFTPHKYWHAYCEPCARALIAYAIASLKLARTHMVNSDMRRGN